MCSISALDAPSDIRIGSISSPKFQFSCCTATRTFPLLSLTKFLKLLAHAVSRKVSIFIGMPLPIGQGALASVCLANPPLATAFALNSSM